MNVFCNGFPKCGNHALMKAVELLGVPGSVNHFAADEKLPEGISSHIFIKRDPRNVIVSWLRFHSDLVTPGKFLARFRRFSDSSLSEEMSRYEGWLSLAYVVRYEDLVRDDSAMRGIAAMLGVPYIDGAWEQLENHTVTWNAVKSDFRSVWTPEVEAVWNEEGGRELLARWGY